ncbi:hypothetical protein KSP40_PGU016002 [Platanthera guangdongensis]|uniref:Uncharacterized protein n=1 Tax=Platanthera guangdongensis TaxID=2320717 RepID=A0ABR2N1A3_9ASPA
MMLLTSLFEYTDQCLPKDPTLMDEQMEVPSIVLNGKNKSGISTCPKVTLKLTAAAKRRKQNKNPILNLFKNNGSDI